MSDEKTAEGRECVACDIVFWGLVGAGALLVGLIAFDTFSGGAASAWIEKTFRKAGPALASVSRIRDESNDADAG